MTNPLRNEPRRAILGLLLWTTVSIGAGPVAPGREQTESERLEQLREVTHNLTDQTYRLQYHFQPGETVYYEVIHQTAVETRVDGNSEKLKSRSRSLKKWHFDDVTSEGRATFSHIIDAVNMWSEMTGRQAVRYDSRTDAEPPADYQSIAKTLGKPISIVTVDQSGQILEREDKVQQIDRGTGGLLVPLPTEAIGLETSWAVPASVQVQLKDGRYQTIKTRQRYRLEKVQTGVATISVMTQVLTPVSDARVRSQLVQKLSHGEIKFDIDAGRMISKTLDWDETVIGFNGPESSMSFLARMTERLVPAAEVASREKAD